MSSYSNNLYKEYKSRYEFASKFISGKVLDFASNAFMAYYGAKTLLNGGASEVVHCNIFNETLEYIQRKKSVSNSIEFGVLNTDETTFPDKFFDCIVSFQTLQHVPNYNDTVKEFYRLLKDDGLLIISVHNKDTYRIKQNSDNPMCLNGFTKDKFVEILESTFPRVTLYSQRLLTRREILENTFPRVTLYSQRLFSIMGILRRILKYILLRVDKNQRFFELHLKNTYLGVYSVKEKIANISNKKEYFPIPYGDEHKPLFFVAICQKKRK